jgi:hypothetical protein
MGVGVAALALALRLHARDRSEARCGACCEPMRRARWDGRGEDFAPSRSAQGGIVPAISDDEYLGAR